MNKICVARGRPFTVAKVTSLALLLAAGEFAAAAPQPPAVVANCATEAATLSRDESDLPRIEVTSPDNRPVLCITIETLMAFATRLRTHVARCPGSAHAASAVNWEKARVDHAKQFAQNRCRRTLPN
jgi:hypothetical protein